MSLKAPTRSGYRWRLGLIGLAMLGFGLYCVYDWQIGYPHKKHVYESYLQIKEQYPQTYPTQWDIYAREQGWSTKVDEKTDTDIRTQLIMALIVLPIGLYFTWKFIVSLNRWIAMDERGLSASGGKQVPYESIRGVDWSRWKTKGIAVVRYDDGGKERRLVLDDWKYETQPIKDMATRLRDEYPDPAVSAPPPPELSPTEEPPTRPDA